ncbi:type VII secretion protein EccB [Glycomyces arizonensis]|uniref:type VII secretion protein EccB n=1 Tax=Glycomyces arizonensis TaxID=256035 RepID=UPI00047CEC32|nr:type VII secretion protein EccB [Glycomyces arizonensis]
MRSRREQVDAHRFITSRMNQALVLANPDSVERPLRRIGVSIFASVMIMVIIFAGFAIAALFNKGNDEPMANHIILEKGTNAIYVYTTKSGGEPTENDPLKLWPVANYTSALLLLQPYDGEPPVQELKPESLSGLPKGFLVGIEGAPPSPPLPDDLLQGELWNVCSSPRTEGGHHYLVQVLVAQADDEDMPPAAPLGEDWLLAETPEGARYLLTGDRKYRITDEAFFDKMRMDVDDVVTVKKEVIDTITAGPDLQYTVREEFKEPRTPSGIVVDGIELDYGQTVVQGTDFYTIIKEGDAPVFAPISDVMRALMEPDLGYGDTVEINSSLLTQYGAQGEYETGDFPKTVPEEPRTLSGERPAVCSTFDPAGVEDGNTDMTIGVYDNAPKMVTDGAESVEMDGEGNIIGTGNPIAHTVLPAGSAALVSPLRTGQTVKSVMFLVHSQGYKYGLKDSGVEYGTTKKLLGYGSVEPVGIPDAVLALIQAGAVLDPVEARSELDPTGESQQEFESGEETPEGSESSAAAEGGE